VINQQAIFEHRDTRARKSEHDRTMYPSGTAGLYFERKRGIAGDNGAVDAKAATRFRDTLASATIHVGEPRAGTFGGAAADNYLHGSSDIIGPQAITIVALPWRDTNYHTEWFPGQLMFSVSNIWYDHVAPVSTSVTGSILPTTVVSAPQLVSLLSRAAGAYSDGTTEKTDLIKIKTAADSVHLIGASCGSVHITPDLTALDVSVAGATRIQNYWGPNVQPGEMVGVIMKRARDAPSASSTDVKALCLYPWSGFGLIPNPADMKGMKPIGKGTFKSSPVGEERGVFFPVGRVISVHHGRTVNPGGSRKPVPIEGAREDLWPLGKFAGEIDEHRAFMEYRTSGDHVVVSIGAHVYPVSL
jgi:hypothetical protein